MQSQGRKGRQGDYSWNVVPFHGARLSIKKKKAERSSRLANREGQKDGLIGGFSKDDPCMLCKLRFQCLRNDHSPDSTHLKCTQESESLSHCPCLAFTYPTQY